MAVHRILIDEKLEKDRLRISFTRRIMVVNFLLSLAFISLFPSAPGIVLALFLISYPALFLMQSRMSGRRLILATVVGCKENSRVYSLGGRFISAIDIVVKQFQVRAMNLDGRTVSFLDNEMIPSGERIILLMNGRSKPLAVNRTNEPISLPNLQKIEGWCG